MQWHTQEPPRGEPSLALYFKDQLSTYAKQIDPPPQEDTCWYLGNLLDRFGRSDAFFAFDNDALTLRPLALLYGDAREARTDSERCLLLQQLGDMALFIGALFPERYLKRGIGRDYFIGMGGGAYDYLADNARGNRHIYAELACMFGHLLEMVANACSRAEQLSADDVLALYERWVRNRDPVAGKQLQALGIELPNSTQPH